MDTPAPGPIWNIFANLHAFLDFGRGILFAGGDYAAEVFLVLTLVLGGAGALASGRAIAQTWRSMVLVPIYCLPLAAAVQFLHYALFDEELLQAHYFLVTYALLVCIAMLGFRLARVKQMTGQYSWAFQQAGPLSWQRAEANNQADSGNVNLR